MSEEIKKSFLPIASIISNARDNAYKKVNEELINMYWNVGKFLSDESKGKEYGDLYIDSVANFIHCRICNEPDNVTYVGFKIYDGTARQKMLQNKLQEFALFLEDK